MLTVFTAILFYVLFAVTIRNRRQQVQVQEAVVQRRRQTRREY